MLPANNIIFVDTSAFYALIDRSNCHHQEASILWPELLSERVSLITSNYVVWETLDLLQKKIGFEAASLWSRDILCVLDIWWLDADLHQRVYELWLNLGRRKLTLVDCASFVTMHQCEIEKAFCFKPYFLDYGFTLLAPSSNFKDE